MKLRHIDNKTYALLVGVILLLLAVYAHQTHAAQVQDLVRLKGSEANHIVGFGLVVGLNGTGDGKFTPTSRALAQAMSRFVDATALASEMKDAKNVAVVQITADIPATGVREGSFVDVHVSSLAAKSLAGGRLFMSPLVSGGPEPVLFAYASGSLVVEDPNTPTVAKIDSGAQMVRDIRTQLTDANGRMTLIIDPAHASWPVANSIAGQINGRLSPDGPDIARVVDPANIIVDIPAWERADPAAFVSQILEVYIDPDHITSGGRVVINQRTGTIVIGGEVQISPVLISHRGLTISTFDPPLEPTQFNPIRTDSAFVPMDPEKRSRGKLEDLQRAFDQLKVPANDRIEILKLLKKSGYLHAQLILE